MSRRSSRGVAIGLLVAAVIIAGVLSYFASSQPDGLERVAEDTRISSSEGEHDLGGGPLADYQTKGVEDEWVSGGLAGVIGVVAVGLAATGLFMLLRPRRDPSDTSSEAGASENHGARQSS